MCETGLRRERLKKGSSNQKRKRGNKTGFLVDAGFIPQVTVDLPLTRMWHELTIRLTAGVVFVFLLVLSICLPISTWLKGAGEFITLSNLLGSLNIFTKAISKFIQRAGEKWRR